MSKLDFWDTHCHLFSSYYPSISDVILDAFKEDVTHFIVSGCDGKSNHEVCELVKQYPSCYGVVGLHPDEADTYMEEDLTFLESCLSNSKIVGIGEIGLDYHYTKENRLKQIELFERQLRLALKYHLPVVIHSREATQDTIDILKKYPVSGIIHSFSGSLEVAKIYIKMGFCLGINGVVTFKNSKLKELLPTIFPSIVLETDSPYLTPHPYRGSQNSPKYVHHIASFIADYLAISLFEVAKVTNQNVYRIFDKLQ